MIHYRKNYLSKQMTTNTSLSCSSSDVQQRCQQCVSCSLRSSHLHGDFTCDCRSETGEPQTEQPPPGLHTSGSHAHTNTHTPPLVEQRSPEQPSYTWTGTFGPTAYIKMLVCLKGRAFVVSEGRGQMTPAVGNA